MHAVPRYASKSLVSPFLLRITPESECVVCLRQGVGWSFMCLKKITPSRQVFRFKPPCLHSGAPSLLPRDHWRGTPIAGRPRGVLGCGSARGSRCSSTGRTPRKLCSSHLTCNVRMDVPTAAHGVANGAGSARRPLAALLALCVLVSGGALLVCLVRAPSVFVWWSLSPALLACALGLAIPRVEVGVPFCGFFADPMVGYWCRVGSLALTHTHNDVAILVQWRTLLSIFLLLLFVV